VEWLLYLLLGGFAGTLAGLFGVGGGAVLVPLLMLVFEAQGLPQTLIVHMAIGTSFATIIFTSLGSVWGHHHKGNILWPLWKKIAGSLAIGVLLGSWIASFIASYYLELIVSVFFLLIAIQMAIGLLPKAAGSLPGQGGVVGTGMGIGFISAFLGIGGGSLAVPWLQYCSVPMHQSVGTSAACGLPIALAGALGYAYFGQAVQAEVSMALGFVYLPAFLGITLASVPAASLGARLAARFSELWLKRCFALMLFLVSSLLLVRALRDLTWV